MKITIFTLLVIGVVLMVSCSEDEPDTFTTIKVNGTVLFDDGDDFNGDVDGDFTGNGGSGTRTFLWQNNLATAEYNADITATSEGIFRMVVIDADGNTVLDNSLKGAVEPDSFSGVTSSGSSGIWSVTITLTNFNGDGSFSLSAGD